MPALAPAQGLTDPTRPAIGYADADAGVATGGPVLQSVMITPTLQSAIISGEMVKLGGKFGSARLVKISESEVVLKDGGETQILKLYPGVEKRAVEKPEAKAAAKRRK
ncbi:MAG: MSHA biogenesis protein MshK [Burkholderiales bacterium]|nr:MSHA biogenesis protein MshK [Burkholderiales bacterium]